MADNTIDSLELQVKANANSAINSLTKLQTQLKHTAKSIGTLTAAANGLDRLTASFGKLEKINIGRISSAVSELERLQKIDLRNLKDKDIKIKFTITGADEIQRKQQSIQMALNKIDVDAIAKKFNDALGLRGTDATKIKRTYEKALGELAEGGNGAKAFASWLDDAFKNGLTISKSAFSEELASMKDEYAEFLKYIEANKLKIDGNGERKHLYETASAYERMKFFTSKGDLTIGDRIEELRQMFPSVMVGIDETNNKLSIEEQMLERIRAALESIQRVGTINLVGEDEEKAIQTLLSAGASAREEIEKIFNSEVRKGMEELKYKIPIETVIDANGIEQQIRDAIKAASEKKYDLGVKFSVDTKSLKGTITRTLGQINADSIGDLTKHLQDTSLALADIGTFDPKGSGLNSFVNSMKRLGETDLSKFDVKSLSEIIKMIGEIANIGDISDKVNRFVSSLARLANAGESTRITSNSLPTLGDNLANLVGKIGSAGALPNEINALVGAISRLANAGQKTEVTTQNLPALGAAVRAFIDDVSGADGVSDSILRMTEAIAQISNSGGKAGTAAKSIGKSFNEMGDKSQKAYTRLTAIASALKDVLEIFKKAGSYVKTGAQKIVSALQQIKNSGKGIDSTTLSIKNLIGAMVGFRGISGLANFFKDAITMGGDITEIDHIVESVFGNMSGAVNSWANNAIEKFGIAAGSAKQYAGTLSAMFQASQIGYQDAGKMAIDLVGLAGDLSAFYNIDTQTSFEKIRSGMAGMVRPLRDLGIDLTAATLEEYRLAQGMQTSYSAMSQAEKVMLRYQYLMSVTTTQQGDFQRTNQSLANSLRTLKAYAAAVQTQIGVGLASAIRHVIVWLNEMMKYVLKAAQAFATFMQTIFGKYKGGASGIAIEGLGDSVDYADDLNSAADGAASGLGDASDAAKQLKKDLSVLPFDELNQLNKDNESTSSGSGSGGSGGSGAGGSIGDGLLDWGDLPENSEAGKLPDAISAWGERIKAAFEEQNWKQLGFEIADGLNDGLQKLYDLLDPKVIREKVFPWVDAFTETFNSFVEHFDFNLLGRTIGRGINDIVDILYRGITGIDWNLLGRQCADGVNGLFDEVNFENVGKLVGAKFMVFWNWLNGFVHDLDWDGLGTNIADFFNGLFEDISFSTIADTIATGLNGAFDSLASFTERFDWEDLADNIGNGIITFISEFEWEENGRKLGDFLQKLADTLVDVVGDVDWVGLGNGIADFLAGIEWKEILPKVGIAICTALGGILKGMLKNPSGFFAVSIIAGLGLLKFQSSSFGSFFSNIVLALTGETPKNLIKGAFASLFKKGVAEGAAEKTVETTIDTAGKGLVSKFASALSGTSGIAAQFGAITVAVAGTAAVIYGLTRAVDKLQGGNGKITEAGEALETYIEKIGESGQLSAEQIDELWHTIEDMESAGSSTGDMVETVRKKLNDWNVSADAQYEILKNLKSGFTTSNSVLDEYEKKLVEATGATGAYSDSVDTAFDIIVDAVYDAGMEVEGFGGKYQTVIEQLYASQGTYHTTGDVINALKSILADMGLTAEDVGIDFENLGLTTEDASTQIDTNMTNAAASVDNFKSGASTSLSEARNKITEYVNDAKSSINEHIGDWKETGSSITGFKTGAQKDLSETANAVSDYESDSSAKLDTSKKSFGDLETGSITSMANMMLKSKLLKEEIKVMSNESSKRADEMKSAFNTAIGDIDTTLENFKKKTQQLMPDIALAIKTGNLEVYRAVQDLMDLISRTLDGVDFKTKGQKMTADLAFGLKTGNLEVYRAADDMRSMVFRALDSFQFNNLGRAMGQAIAEGLRGTYIPIPHLYVAEYVTVTNSDGSWYSYPNWGVSWYRAGGLFKGGNGQLIGIAEDGRDEAVLPLEDRKAMSRIGNAIAEAGGASSTNEQLANRIAEKFAEVILMNKEESDPIFNITVKTENDEVLARAVTRGQQKLDYRNRATPSYGY